MSKIMNKKSHFYPLSYSFLVMYSDILWVTFHVLLQMKGLIKLLNTGKFIEDSTFTSHFSDCQKLS